MSEFILLSFYMNPASGTQPSATSSNTTPLLEGHSPKYHYFQYHFPTTAQLFHTLSFPHTVQIIFPRNTAHFCQEQGFALPPPSTQAHPLHSRQIYLRLDLEALLTYYDTPPPLEKLLTDIAALCQNPAVLKTLSPTHMTYFSKLFWSTLTCAEGGAWQLTANLLGKKHEHDIFFHILTGLAGGAFSSLVRYQQTRYSHYHLPKLTIISVLIQTALSDISWQPIINACSTNTSDGVPNPSVILFTGLGCAIIFWMVGLACRFGCALWHQPTRYTVMRLAKDPETFKDNGTLLCFGDAAAFCVTLFPTIQGHTNPIALKTPPESPVDYLWNSFIAGLATCLGGLCCSICITLYTYWQDYHNGRTTLVPKSVYDALNSPPRITEMRRSSEGMRRTNHTTTPTIEPAIAYQV